MKKIFVLLVIAGFISCNDRSEIRVNQVPMKWQYDVPATKYWEGLPVGTGRFAAMIPGAIDHEVIAFNDETLWTGGPYNPVREGGPEALGKLREYALPAITSMPKRRHGNSTVIRLTGQKIIAANSIWTMPPSTFHISILQETGKYQANY
jgi:hypothetical protein